MKVWKPFTVHIRRCLPLCLSSEMNFIAFCSLDRYRWAAERKEALRLTLETQYKILGSVHWWAKGHVTEAKGSESFPPVKSNPFVCRHYLWRNAQVTAHWAERFAWDWHPRWIHCLILRDTALPTIWLIFSTVTSVVRHCLVSEACFLQVITECFLYPQPTCHSLTPCLS